MRLVFMGSPDFAVPTLATIVARGHEVAAVYARSPKPAGRGLAEQSTPVQRWAEHRGIPVFTPSSLRDEAAAAIFTAHGAETAVVVAYGLILPKAILAAPARGCLNLHASLLPRWRGAAPIQRAVMAGDAETGVSVMLMEEGLDTGPVGLVEPTPIGLDETAGALHDRLADLGAEAMARALDALAKGAIAFRAQPEEGVTYAPKITNAETRIDWSRPAGHLHNVIRGLSPHPGAFFEADLGRGPERVKVLRAALSAGAGPPGSVLDGRFTTACGAGAIRLVAVQRSGRGRMSGEDFLRGTSIEVGGTLA